MTEGLNLPNPDETLDVWGDQLNDAITFVNDKVDQASAEIDQLEEIISSNPTNMIPLTQKGAVNGVAVLDGAGQVPLNQLGNIGPSSIGAAPAQHQHGLTDIPDVQRALRNTPVFTVFNTTTSQWPSSRAALTTDALRPVIWFGGTALPADAIPAVDAWIKTDANQLVVTAPGGGTTTPPPSSGLITMSQPTVSVNGSLYNITGTITNGTANAVTFAYAQLAVRGPGGTPSADTGHRSGLTLQPGEVVTLTGSGDATVVGDWTVRVAYTLNESDWFDGTSRTFTIAAIGGGGINPGDPPGTRTIPLIGRSGLPWNSGVFRGAGELDRAQQFADWRNRPIDSIMYFPGRTNQSDLNWMRPDLNNWPGYRIISVPAQVPSRGNNFGTNPEFIQFWKDWGTKAKNQGWNDGRTIVRLNWEANGDWYQWAWVRGGAALFVQTYKSVVDAIRSTAPKMIFNLCMNRNNVNGGINWQTQIYNPLIDHIDIVGLDWYDEWPNWRTQSSFNASVNVTMPNPGPANIAAWCRANGKMMWLDEWGMSHRPEAGDAAGKDDPAGIGFMWTWLQQNQDVVAGETFYEDYGTNDQYHGFMEFNKNPLAAAAYRSASRWGR